MLGKKLFTKQTGEQGRICNEVSELQQLSMITFSLSLIPAKMST